MMQVQDVYNCWVYIEKGMILTYLSPTCLCNWETKSTFSMKVDDEGKDVNTWAWKFENLWQYQKTLPLGKDHATKYNIISIYNV